MLPTVEVNELAFVRRQPWLPSPVPAAVPNGVASADAQRVARLNEVNRVLEEYAAIPRRKEYLERHVTVAGRAVLTVRNALKAPGLSDTANRLLRRDLAELLQTIAIFRGLQRYHTPEGRAFVHQVMSGGPMVPGGLQRKRGLSAYENEPVDPVQRCSSLGPALQRWLGDQRAKGLDPAENIIDFFLAFESTASVGLRKPSRLEMAEVFVPEDTPGVLCGYYVEKDDGRARYRGDEVAQVVLSCHRAAFDTRDGLADGQGGEDFVISPEGKIYSDAGDAAQATGRWVVRQGKVKRIHNSGHSRTSLSTLWRAVRRLHELDVLDPDAVVCAYQVGGFRLFKVPDFLRLGAGGFHDGAAAGLPAARKRDTTSAWMERTPARGSIQL